LQKPQEPPRKNTYWTYLYLLVLLPCLIYTVVYTVRAIKLDYTPVPIWDSWRSVQYLDKLLRFDVRHFWVQHNEHRIVFPEVVYALDYILFRGEELLPFASNVACQLTQLALLWWLLLRMKDMPLVFRLTLGVCVSLIMTSAMQVQGLLGTFEVQWYMSQTAAVLAFVFLSQSKSTGRWAALAVSIGAAVIATYSTGNGMMIWPVLVTMSVLLRLPKLRIAVVAVAGILSIAAYFVGYIFVSQGRATLLLTHPAYTIWFVGVFLGTPLSYISVQLGGVSGLAGLLLAALAVTIAYRRGRPAHDAPGLLRKLVRSDCMARHPGSARPAVRAALERGHADTDRTGYRDDPAERLREGFRTAAVVRARIRDCVSGRH
jgi:hypothetical protein